MALSATDVVVGLSGGVFYAPATTVLPADATTALIAGYLELGYITEDGVTQSTDEATQKIIAWQYGAVVREVQTSHDLMYSFAAMESNVNVLTAFYGNYTTGAIEINGAPGYRGRWVIQVIDGDTDIRIVIPDGQLTDRGDIQYVNGNAAVYPMTLTCFPDSDYAGTEDQPAKAYMYIDRLPTA